ncbi:Hypothetical_protein [Hexamita inflata]|uniref:Hypothetical_protein n=1 Tax=Hexamita inflata TaxID=28002 RepID=A0AA86QKX8_9EUKA|nr:Hypothetical protein HINF_LOCUS46062 [Hexamita inflata]
MNLAQESLAVGIYNLVLLIFESLIIVVYMRIRQKLKLISQILLRCIVAFITVNKELEDVYFLFLRQTDFHQCHHQKQKYAESPSDIKFLVISQRMTGLFVLWQILQD